MSNSTKQVRSKSKSDVSVVKLSSYESPKVSEVASSERQWVTYGEHNRYFRYLNSCYRESTTNRSIINNISRRIYGRGLDATNAEEYPVKMKALLKLLTKRDMKKSGKDLKQNGQCALQIGWNKAHNRVIKVEHLPIETIAIGKKDNKGEINFYYYLANWESTHTNDPQKIPAFGTSTKQVELLYINEPSSGNMYYADTDYNAALPYCEMEKEISVFHLNNIKNGFTPSMLLNFNNGVPTEKIQAQTESKVLEKFAGTSNAGTVIFSFNANAEAAATLEAVKLSDADKQYQFIANEAESKIMMGHSVTSPVLVGIREGGGLGNNAEELKNADALFNTNVVEPFQEMLLDGLEPVLAVNNLDVLDLYFKPLTPWIFTDEEIDEVDEDTKDIVEKETGVSIEEDKPVVIKETVEDGQTRI